MRPKKSTTTAKTATKKDASHPSYADMIKEAVISLKERAGSSRQAVKKYVLANNSLGSTTDAQFTSQFNKALLRGSENGTFTRPKGTSGPIKLAAPKSADSKPTAKAATKIATAKKTVTTTATEKKPAAKKVTAAKTTATKKAPAKKTATKATTTKKIATNAKANTGKARKTPAAAPAVEEKAPVVLGKTKSGRVTKSTAPQAEKKAAKPRKPAAKEATPKKTKTPTKA